MKKNTIILDIDGILADYRLGLLYWIRQSCPEYANKANAHLLKKNTWINHETMEMSYYEWLKVLEMFRMSGGKRSIPLFEGAQKLNQICTYLGEVILLTSRPIDIYSNIYRDTVEWLRDSELKYHMLLWSKNKAEMIYKMRLTDKVLFAVDDEKTHIIEYTNLGIKTYWVDLYNKHKEDEELNSLIQVVSSIEKINELLIKGIENEYSKN